MDANKDNETKKLFYKINKITHTLGMPNFWFENTTSKNEEKIHYIVNAVTNGLVAIFISAEISSFFTQTNLTEKQKSDQLLYGLSHPTLFGFFILMSSYKHKVREVFYELAVHLKKVHNDIESEKQMVAKLKLTLTALLGLCAMAVLLYTVDSVVITIKTGNTFNPIFLCWPDVDDRSTMAYVVRFISYILWWLLCTRIYAMYVLVISVMICLSSQYKNLQSYFYSIEEVFDEKISQEEKEKKYEKAFRAGIKLHVDILRCTEDCRIICKGVFSGQIVYNITLLVVSLTQLVAAERTIMNIFAAGITATAILVSTGFFMWNAGDVTVEASGLATAMFFSGWHNCTGEASLRVRKLVTISMLNAQQPVVMKGLGVIELSYQSYVSIVKSSYSAFSVVY